MISGRWAGIPAISTADGIAGPKSMAEFSRDDFRLRTERQREIMAAGIAQRRVRKETQRLVEKPARDRRRTRHRDTGNCTNKTKRVHQAGAPGPLRWTAQARSRSGAHAWVHPRIRFRCFTIAA
jgi:hypothetical protein